jgi:hypothetical protein
MSTWDKVQKLMVQEPSVFQAIFVDGMRTEQKYQESVRNQGKGIGFFGQADHPEKGIRSFSVTVANVAM